MAGNHSVVEFERATSQHSDEIFVFLEDHVDEVHDLSISDGLMNDEKVSALDDFLRGRHADVQLQSLRLPNNRLTSRSSNSLASIVQTAQSLVKLDLSGNQLKAEGLLQIKHTLCEPCCTLKKLDLSDNRLGSAGAVHVASIIGENRSIEELLISRNEFGKRSLKVLCKHLADNPVVMKLDLSYNKVNAGGAAHLAPVLDPTTSRSRLTHLDLTHNPIRDSGLELIVGALVQGNNTYLRHLNVSRTQLTQEGGIFLGHLLKFSYALEELIVARNKLGHAGVTQLCYGLQGSVNVGGSALKFLDLEMNELDDESATELGETIQGNDTLERLNLSDNGIRSDGAKHLALSLHSNLALRDLNLERNQIRDSGAIALAESLCKPSCRLKTLGWKKNPISELGQKRLMGAFQLRDSRRIWLDRFLGEIEKRRHMPINLMHRTLSDDEIIVIVNHLKKYRPRLPNFQVSGEAISVRSAKAVAKDLLASNHVNVQRLQFRRTAIGDHGAAAFAQVVQSNSTLRVLSLQSCGITCEGLKFLSRAIARTHTITRLDLIGNQIGDEGAQEFFDTVLDPPHPSLCGVSFANNRIGDRGITTLRSFGNLDLIDLSYNNITDRGALDLSKVALSFGSKRAAPPLKLFCVSHNHISERGIQAMQLFFPADVLQNHGQKTTSNT